MNSIHAYQCGSCGKMHKGENSFEDALYCCRVQEVWECGKCGKKYKGKNARKQADSCCLERARVRKHLKEIMNF